jgi:two-component system response regulator PilR (NtrC family)
LINLQNYPFPGNVRELENTLERAYTLSENNLIDIDDLQLRPTENGTATDTRVTEQIPESTVSATSTDNGSLDNYLEEIEKQAILKALEETRWNRTAAAEKLGISFRQIRHRLKKFGIE